MTDRRGEIRLTLLQVLATGGPGTSRQLASKTKIGFASAMWTLRNMVNAGEVMKLQPVRVPGVKRPVPVYGLADGAKRAPAGSALQSALQAWR